MLIRPDRPDFDNRPDLNIGSSSRKGWRWRGAVALVATVWLAGCSWLQGDNRTACPVATIVPDAASITQFRPGAGQDLSDIVSHGTLSNVSGTCIYDSTGAHVDLYLTVGGERGPALQGNQASYQYFVAVASPDRTILAKRVFDTAVAFSGGAVRAGSRENVVETIPLPKDRDAGGYSVLVGFQLTQDQLAYNQKAAQH